MHHDMNLNMFFSKRRVLISCNANALKGSTLRRVVLVRPLLEKDRA